MEKALYIFVGLYFVPVLGIVVEFHLNFPPSGTLLIYYTLMWTADGLGCMVMGIVVLRRHVPLLFDSPSIVPVLAGLSGVLLGLVPSYVLVEMIIKLVRLVHVLAPLLESSP